MILITGGTGYIGSHTCVALVKAGHKVILLDNLSNSRFSVIDRLTRICGFRPEFVQCDIRDRNSLDRVFEAHPISAVIHFAALKAVGESVAKPLDYYDNNVNGTLCLLRAMEAASIKTIVFSSSATVYGEPQKLPLTEDHPLSATNPYGRTKLFIEEILHDIYRADPAWRIGILRYFNPVGAHESGLIGEDPQGTPNNLMPFIAQVAVGRREKLNVCGNDYPTPDGTGVRDYIHVVDLANGHLKALERLVEPQCFTVNLGTGSGYSVLNVIKAFEKASGRPIPYNIAPRRPGDVAACYADPTLAATLLAWRAERDLDAMCADHWRWQRDNPRGYA